MLYDSHCRQICILFVMINISSLPHPPFPSPSLPHPSPTFIHMRAHVRTGSSFIRAFTQSLNSSFSVPGPYLQSTSPIPPVTGSESGLDQSTLFPTTSRNPNKAIVTVDAHTSKILVTNEMTCELFGYQRSELSGMKVQHLFTKSYRSTQRALVEQNITSSGETKLVSGKVVSGWMKHFHLLITCYS